MPHQRVRPGASHATCSAVRAGNRIFLHGQSGRTLDGRFTGYGDPAAQAKQAMQNVRVLLEEAGSRMQHIGKITTYVTDRAWQSPVQDVIARHMGVVSAAAVVVIVSGLAMPEMLVEIEVDAVVPAP